jgi:hypothetical protein
MKTKAEAKKAATNLRRRLGSGWKIRMWENMGWHYSVSTAGGRVSVSPSFLKNTFFCMISLSLPGGGDIRCGKSSGRHFKDPWKAVDAAFAQLREVVVTDVKALLEIADNIGEVVEIEYRERD